MKTRLRVRKCDACKVHYKQERPLQMVCSYHCASKLVEIKKAKKAAKQLKKDKADLKTITDWLKITQRVFNEFIRLRDKDKPCISCGTHKCNKWDAGHFRTVKAASNLRFNEDNVHKQCSFYCNHNLSGNIEGYRRGIIDRIGEDRVDRLLSSNETVKYTREQLEALRKFYRLKIKQLKGDQNVSS